MICIHVCNTKLSALIDGARRLIVIQKHNALNVDEDVNPILTSAQLAEDDDDDDVMFIPTPTLPYEKQQPILNVDDDVNSIPTPTLPCEKQQPILNDDDVDVKLIPTPLQVVKPKG